LTFLCGGVILQVMGFESLEGGKNNIENIGEKQVGSNEEQLVEDVNAAWEAAKAEDPARTFLIEHKSELSEEQKKALEWFATSEGEKALANFWREKEEQKDIIRERMFNILKITKPGVFLTEKLEERIGRSKRSKDVLKEVNEELVPLLFKERINVILSSDKNLAEKLEEVEKIKFSFKDGAEDMVSYDRITLSPTHLGSYDKEGFFYGKVAICLASKQWEWAARLFKGWKINEYPVNLDELLEKLGDKISEGHSNEAFNRAMESRNFIFNPEKNRYEKVER
jgi:hypothetical protein